MSEVEWEYACRAGSPYAYTFGDEAASLEGTENCADAYFASKTNLPAAEWTDPYVFHAPVGSMIPNEFGLYDMHGNVSEWCEDWDNNEDPPRRRSFRDGSWYTPPIFCRSALRGFDFPSSANYSRGLRVARPVRPNWDPSYRYCSGGKAMARILERTGGQSKPWGEYRHRRHGSRGLHGRGNPRQPSVHRQPRTERETRRGF